MTADAPQSRDHGPRVALRASVLVLVLVSLSAGAASRHAAANAAATAIRHTLPVVTAGGLGTGIRFEIPATGVEPVPGDTRPRLAGGDAPTARAPMLREALLDLPPPAAC